MNQGKGIRVTPFYTDRVTLIIYIFYVAIIWTINLAGNDELEQAL